MVREFLRNKKLENDYLLLQEKYSNTTMVLGYYSLRFGPISTEDLEKMVGLESEKLGLKK